MCYLYNLIQLMLDIDQANQDISLLRTRRWKRQGEEMTLVYCFSLENSIIEADF